MYNVQFGNMKTWDDFKLSLDGYTIDSPDVVTDFVGVPYSSKFLDLTEVSGEPTYKQRNAEFTFTLLPNEGKSWEETHREVMNALHGQRLKIFEPRDIDYFYVGRISVSGITYQKSTAHFTVSAVCDPYRYRNEVTIVERKLIDVLSLSLENSRMRTIATIKTQAPITVSFNGNQYSFAEGSHILPQQLVEGANDIKVSNVTSLNLLPLDALTFEDQWDAQSATFERGKAPRSALENPRNYLKRVGEVLNSAIGMTGTNYTQAGHSASDYINIPPGTYSLKRTVATGLTDYNVIVNYYNSSKSFLSRDSFPDAQATFIVPEGASFIRISFPTQSSITVVSGTVPYEATIPAWEDVPSDEKPLNYKQGTAGGYVFTERLFDESLGHATAIHTRGGTSQVKYRYQVPGKPQSKRTASVHINNIGTRNVRLSDIDLSSYDTVLPGETKELSISYEKTYESMIFASVTAIHDLDFVVSQPVLYEESLVNNIEISYQEGVL